ncbi:MAG: histidine kinase [Ideonella sp.]
MIDDSIPSSWYATEVMAQSKTLTTFDWLDTISDDLVAASDRKGLARVKTSSPQREFWQKAEDLAHGMSGDRILSQVVLGYSPVMDQRHGVIATRLTVVPLDVDAPLDAGSLLREVSDVWPEGTGAVSLNLASETLLRDLLQTTPTPNVMIEVPAFVAVDPANVLAIRTLASRGNLLLLKGRPERELPPAVLPCFKWAIIDIADDRRIGRINEPPSSRRTIPHIHIGVHTMAQLRQSFSYGAIAVIGWPIDDPIADQVSPRHDLQIVLQLIHRVDRHDAVAAIERTLIRDFVLAYDLLNHVNATPAAVAFETSSIHHAITLFGPERMRRWLGQKLADASDDTGLRPANFSALRRAIMMRLLANVSSSHEVRGEMFMCGFFSLLDRVMGKPAEELWKSLVIPQGMRQALVDRVGPLFMLLELIRAIESEVPQDIRQAASGLFIEPLEINCALMSSLNIASILESDVDF